MKMILSLVLLAGFALADTAEQEVRAAHDAFLKAAKEGDAAGLNKVFADGLQYSHSSGKLETKKEAVDALAKNKGNFDLHEQSVMVFGKTATIRAKMTSHNPTGDIKLSVLLVWVKNGNQWQMVQRQTTRLP